MKVAKSQSPLDTAVATIRIAIDDAMATAELAVNKAIRVGHLLIETKPLLGHGNFQEFIATEFPQVSYDTAHRWMQAAERTMKAVGLDQRLLTLPVSEMLNTAAEDLPDDAAREAQQLLFDFTRDKTIKDCLAAVVVDGDEPHRITRAANGKTKGGTRGEDRKDFPKFIGVHLSDISAHLKSWSKFTPQQAEEVLLKYGSHFGKCPTTLLGQLKTLITDELKTR